MSVFTPLTGAELETFIAPYALGRLKHFEGISGGAENSNFHLSLEAGEFVLTLVERAADLDLQFCLALLQRLHQAGLPVPFAVATQNGETLRELAGKPALLQPFLPGSHVQQPGPQHCSEVGRWLAHMHLATGEQPLEHPSDRDLQWMLREGAVLAVQLPPRDLLLLRGSLSEIERLQEHIGQLPRANLHADLFRDNVLFEGSHLCGVIDFYNACSGPMLYDLAIAVNDWCSMADGRLDHHRANALLGAYAALRPFRRSEMELWPAMLRIACLRFWLSRLLAAGQGPRPGVLLKNPQEFRDLLARRQQVDLALPLAL
jgi:homoserine kinase type II